MSCNPRWDPWIFGEGTELNIKSTAGVPINSFLHTTLGTTSVSLTNFRSAAGLPLDGEATVTITGIKDPSLDDNGNPKDSFPTEFSVGGEMSGLRKGDSFDATFQTYNLIDPQEGVEYNEEDYVGSKVKSDYNLNIITFSIESMRYDSNGPTPGTDVQDVNNMFWENHAMDCKASGDGQSLRRMASNDPGANWLIDSPGNKWDSYCGWELLFTGHTPNLDDRQSGKHPKKGTCLQLATNNQMSAGQGIILGNWSAHQKNQVARWMNPTGVQFQWTTRNTERPNANGLKLKRLWLIYKEANDGVPRYCPLIDNYEAKGVYEYEGENIVGYHQKKGKYGNFRASISAEDIIQVNERDSVCIAMLMEFNNAKAGTMYYNTIDIYNFTFLFYNAKGTIDEYTGIASATTPPTLPKSSRLIVPAPFPMNEWDSGNFPIF